MDLQNQQEEFTIPSVVEYPQRSEEGIVSIDDPIALDIPDDKLNKIIDKRIDESRNFFKQKYNLYERRLTNENFLFGRQIKEKEDKRGFKPYEARYLDNALYEIEASIKPLAMQKLPDLIVTPGNQSDQAKTDAQNISKIVDDDIKKRENRKVLGVAFKHLPVYFTGIVKARWNPELGKYGDYVFESKNPKYIDVDHTCPTNNSDDMEFIAETLPVTVQDTVMRFPSARGPLLEKLRTEGIVVGDDFSEKDLASQINIREVWFKWYQRTDTKDVVSSKNEIPQEPGVRWEQIRGVIWKYKNVILKKIKNPNFDYEGDEQTFVYDDPADENSKRPASNQELMFGAITGIQPTNMTKELTYKNYFQMPRAPYFFMGYDQWGKIPYDETSRIEQNIRNQQNLDKRGKEIQEALDEKGKHVYSKDGGLEAEDIENMDMNDPNQDILVEGDVNKVHNFIPPRTPSPQEFQDLKDTRDRMYGLAGASAVRGQIQSDVATTNQIAREADYTRADDLVEDTINAAAEWMAQWAMQFIKLRYTEPHMRKLLGDKGTFTFVQLKTNMIQDGMDVLIKASGTDKLKAQNNAMDMAKLQLIDPVTFYEDMGLSDPEGRANKLLAFLSGAPTGYATYILQYLSNQPQLSTQGLTNQLLGGQSVPSGGNVPPEQAAQPGTPPGPGGQVPQGPTPTNTGQTPAAPPTGAPLGSVRNL